jgi:GT2 family glycosyltransferase
LQADRRDVQLVTASGEQSYAAAANLGAAQARGRWLLFLDSDVVLRRGAVERMAQAGGANTIVGGRLTDLEGRDRQSARAGSLTAWSAVAVALNWPGAKLRRNRQGGDAPKRVAAVSGALMLIPRGDFQALRGFDEGFATDAADLDLCRRAAAMGASVLFFPAAAGVQFERRDDVRRRRAQGLALFAVRSAKTPGQKVFASIARPALAVLLGLKDFVGGRR